MATMSLLGLYNYDESLLDGMIESLPNKYGIPSAYTDSYYTDVTIDPQTVVENLLVECAEFEILYSDFNALKRIIKIWSAKEKLVWQKMYNTICYKYNPIWNKDGKSVWTERQTGSGTKKETEKEQKPPTPTEQPMMNIHLPAPQQIRQPGHVQIPALGRMKQPGKLVLMTAPIFRTGRKQTVQQARTTARKARKILPGTEK